MIFIASDHRGFELKSDIVRLLTKKGIEVHDQGPFTYDPDDDYPRYASLVCQEMSGSHNSKAILLCGSGVGICVAANKFKGIRASIGFNVAQVEAGRLHDDMNVLVLASNFTTFEDAQKLVEAFLNTEYDALPHHDRRLKQIDAFEKDKI